MYKNKQRWLRWTPLTALCFKRHCICEGCPEANACDIGESNRISAKLYGLKNVKEAVLKLYAEFGKPKGE